MERAGSLSALTRNGPKSSSSRGKKSDTPSPLDVEGAVGRENDMLQFIGEEGAYCQECRPLFSGAAQ